MTGILSDAFDRPSLAKELDCSERTIARYEGEADGLEYFVIAGRHYYWRASVLSFLQKRRRKPNPRRAA